MTFLIIFLFVMGLIWGSFLNVVILRTAKNKSFVGGRSECPKCKNQLAWYDNIPLLSYFLLGKKCRYCKKSISFIYPVVEFLTGIFFVWWFLIGFGFFRLVGSPWTVLQPIFWLLVGLIFIVIFIVDLLYMIIPFGLNLALFLLVTVYRISLVASGNMRAVDLFSAVVAGLAVSLGFSLINRITRKLKGVDGFGLGDIYLIPSLSILLGWQKFVVAIVFSFVIGSVVGIILLGFGKKRKNDYIPFGPFLIMGTVLALLYGGVVWDWYFSLLV